MAFKVFYRGKWSDTVGTVHGFTGVNEAFAWYTTQHPELDPDQIVLRGI